MDKERDKSDSETAGNLPPVGSAAFDEYAKPLTDSTDGSEEEIRKAHAIASICWKLALLEDPDLREKTMDQIKAMLPFNEEEFAQFRQDILEMMIERHRRMFPDLHSQKGE